MNDDARPVQGRYTYTLTIGARCRMCIMPKLLTHDLRDWDHMPDDGDVAGAIMDHVERRCGMCIEGCWVEVEGDHFHIFVTPND